MHSLKSLLLFACLSLMTIVGCKDKDADLRNDLKSFALAYVTYQDEHKVGPANWDELIKYAEEKDDLNPEAVGRVRSAGYEVTWSAKGSGADEVMAKSSNGPTVYMNGLVGE